PPSGDCSAYSNFAVAGEELSDEEIDASDCPQTLIERQRQQREYELRGMQLMENRLLTLIEGQGQTNPDKVAQLQETLSRVRAEKATAELRLSRFTRGLQ